jgi:hypothetical protein
VLAGAHPWVDETLTRWFFSLKHIGSALIEFRGGADETNVLCELVRFTDFYIGFGGKAFS